MRVFNCGNCGHHMRFGGERCGRCYAEKPLLKSVPFYAFLTYVLLFAGGTLLVLTTLMSLQ